MTTSIFFRHNIHMLFSTLLWVLFLHAHRSFMSIFHLLAAILQVNLFFLTPFFLCQYSSDIFSAYYIEKPQKCAEKKLCVFSSLFWKRKLKLNDGKNEPNKDKDNGWREKEENRPLVHMHIQTGERGTAATHTQTHIHVLVWTLIRSHRSHPTFMHLGDKKIFILKCCVKVKFLLPEFCFIIVISFAECRLWWCCGATYALCYRPVKDRRLTKYLCKLCGSIRCRSVPRVFFSFVCNTESERSIDTRQNNCISRIFCYQWRKTHWNYIRKTDFFT